MKAEIEVQTEGAEAVSIRERGVIEALRKIRFGSVEVIIHDGQVVQIERKEKVRFTP